MADRTALARQIIDQWPSDDGSADEAENYFDFGLWGQTSQPLVRRGLPVESGPEIDQESEKRLLGPLSAITRGVRGMDVMSGLVNSFLPFGEYEDGSIAPAWPAALADPYEAAVRILEHRNMPGDELIAAGGAALGGIPFAAKGAVGSAGGRLTRGAPQEAALAPAAVNALTDNSPTGIRAYHGSPHDFDRFSLDKIGTGEGNQAYGHGLYFAENEGVAKSYRDALAASANVSLEAHGWLSHGGGKRDVAVRELKKIIADAEKQTSSILPPLTRDGRTTKKMLQDELPAMKAALVELEALPENLGRMYEVNIKADPDQFLDWDLPLSQQSETIRKAMTRLANGEILSTYTGMDSLRSVAMQMGSQKFLEDPELSLRLREAGIPGIRYLDEGSRAAGEGSRNYVVFDDSLIDILKKYANAPSGAPFALAGDEFDPEGNALMDALRRRQEVY